MSKLTYLGHVIKVAYAAFLGSMIGVFIPSIIITGFALMIMTPIFNVYYAFIFLVVGSFYTYKIVRKNQIQFSMDNDFAPSIGRKSKDGPIDIFGMQIHPPIRKRGEEKFARPDRFLRGGIEEQPEAFSESTGGST